MVGSFQIFGLLEHLKKLEPNQFIGINPLGSNPSPPNNKPWLWYSQHDGGMDLLSFGEVSDLKCYWIQWWNFPEQGRIVVYK
jgi:hypothetical protein